MNPSSIIQVRNILCKVVYDFEAKDNQEMSVNAGDIVEVVKRYRDGWSWCYLRSSLSSMMMIEEESYGMVPTAYLNEIEDITINTEETATITTTNTNSSIEVPSSNSQSFTDSSTPIGPLEKHNNSMKDICATTSFAISKNCIVPPQTTVLLELPHHHHHIAATEGEVFNQSAANLTIFQDEDFNQVCTEQSDNLSCASYRTDCTDFSINGGGERRRRSRKTEILSKIGSFFRKSKKNENGLKSPKVIIKQESFSNKSTTVTTTTTCSSVVPRKEEEAPTGARNIEKPISTILNPIFPQEVLNDVKKKVTNSGSNTETTTTTTTTNSSSTKRESISFNLFSRQRRSRKQQSNSHQQQQPAQPTVTDHMQLIAYKMRQLHRKKAMQRYLKTEIQFKPAKKRLELIKETIDTERTYVNLLKAFIDTFYNPIVNDTGHGKGILTKEVYNTLFSNIEQIYKINNTLLHDWENEYNYNYPFVNIGKAFSLISPFLKAYTIYINNFDRAQETFERLREKDKKFKEYLSECYKNKLVRGTQLGGFLILPVQRIPRYKMLIQEMLKNTPDQHQEYEILQKCAKEIESIAAFVNDEKRNVEQNQTVFDVQNLVQKQYPTFVQPNRKFIRKGSLKVKITIHRIEEYSDHKRANRSSSSKHSSLTNSSINEMSCLMTCREAKYDVYLFTDVMVLIEIDKNKPPNMSVLNDEKVHFIFLQFVDCRDFVTISHNGKSRDVIVESPPSSDSLLLLNPAMSVSNNNRGSLQQQQQWDPSVYLKRIEHEDFSFVIEALYRGVKTEYSFKTKNSNEKKLWMNSIRDCLEGLNRCNVSKGIEHDIYLIGKERISLNKIAKCKLEEHQSLEKGCLLKVSYLTQLEQHIVKKQQQLLKLQKEIEIYNLDRDQVMLESKTLQEKKSKIREDLKFYYLSIQERDSTMIKLLSEVEQSFKLIFDDVPTVEPETVYKM